MDRIKWRWAQYIHWVDSMKSRETQSIQWVDIIKWRGISVKQSSPRYSQGWGSIFGWGKANKIFMKARITSFHRKYKWLPKKWSWLQTGKAWRIKRIKIHILKVCWFRRSNLTWAIWRAKGSTWPKASSRSRIGSLFFERRFKTKKTIRSV